MKLSFKLDEFIPEAQASLSEMLDENGDDVHELKFGHDRDLLTLSLTSPSKGDIVISSIAAGVGDDFKPGEEIGNDEQVGLLLEYVRQLIYNQFSKFTGEAVVGMGDHEKIILKTMMHLGMNSRGRLKILENETSGVKMTFSTPDSNKSYDGGTDQMIKIEYGGKNATLCFKVEGDAMTRLSLKLNGKSSNPNLAEKIIKLIAEQLKLNKLKDEHNIERAARINDLRQRITECIREIRFAAEEAEIDAFVAGVSLG